MLVLGVGSGWLLLLMSGTVPRIVDWLASFVPQWMSIPIIIMLPLSYALSTLDFEINWKMRFLFYLLLLMSCSLLPVAERTRSAASLLALGLTYLELLWLIPKINERLRIS
jgi:hypothetical protein